MREIKFRAWLKEAKQMIKVYDISWDKKMINTFGPWRYFGELELMQYTGLKDKNGVEIYEGDIIRFLWGSISFYAEVTFSKGAYVLKNQNTSELNVLRSEHVDLLLREVGNCEIIGDVYQNPELLEVE